MLSFLKRLDDMAGAEVEDSRWVLTAGLKGFYMVIFYLHLYHLAYKWVLFPLLNATVFPFTLWIVLG